MKIVTRSLGAMLLLATISAVPASATLITYEIDFEAASIGSGPTPTGTFTWDTSTDMFTSFMVSWDGNTFNLLSEANAPYINGTDACSGYSTSSPSASYALFFSPCTGSSISTNTYWGATTTGPMLAISDNRTSSTDYTCIDSGGGTCVETFQAEGLISGVTAIPEPSSWALALIGLGWVVRKRFVRLREPLLQRPKA
jgi:PEP-CTERM motif-containing protein